MGRHRSKSKYGRKEKGRKTRSTRRDNSDPGSYLSDLDEVSSDDEYHKRGKWNSKRTMKTDILTSDEDHSDSDSEDYYNPSRRRIQKEPLSHSDSSDDDDSNFDNRSKFSARINRIRRDHEDSSANSDTDSDASLLSRSSRHQQSQQQLLSRQPSARSMRQAAPNLSSSFQEQMQTSMRSINQGMLSTSMRSMGSIGPAYLSGQQYQGQNQSQRMNRAPGQNMEGPVNPRFSPGPAQMRRPVLDRSSHSYSQMQLNRPGQSGNLYSPPQVSPTLSHKSLKGVPGPSVYVQSPGALNVSSRSNPLSNNEALVRSQINRQPPGLMRGASNRSLVANGMHSQQPGMIRMASQNNLGNNNPLLGSIPLEIERPGFVRSSSHRSLTNNKALLNSDSIQPNPNARMDSTGQSNLVIVNSATSTMDISGVTSKISGSSSKTKRTPPGESLADQIYSQSRNRNRSRSRHSDTRSMCSFQDPPGEDSSRWGRKVDEFYSDDSSYDSFAEDRKGCGASIDPPDSFDDDECIYSDVSQDKSENNGEESFRSKDDRPDFYDEDNNSYFSDEFHERNHDSRVPRKTAGTDRYNRRAGGSVSESSRSSFRGKKSTRRKQKSRSGRTERSFDPPEIDPSVKSDRDVDSFKRDKHAKNRDNVAATSQQASMSWLAQQISTRKSKDTNTRSRYLEPEGTSINHVDSLSKDIKARDADGCSASSLCDRIKNETKRHKPRDAMISSSKTRKLRSDNSSTTTDTMAKGVPSVIDVQDSDSSLSTSDDESSPNPSARYHNGSKRNPRQSVSKTSMKTRGVATFETSGSRGKERRMNSWDDDFTSKSKNSSKKDPIEDGGSRIDPRTKTTRSQKKNGRRETRRSTREAPSVTEEQSNRTENCSQNKTRRRRNTRSSKSSGARKPTTSSRDPKSKRQLDEIQSFEDQQSVMSLIDQLKAFEVEV